MRGLYPRGGQWELAVEQPGLDWHARLAAIVATMREMSSQTDPQEMVRAYAKRMEGILRRDRLLSLSRRGHTAPEVRVTRNSDWKHSVNPWLHPERLPLVKGGLLAELIYGDEPRVIDNLDVPSDDPGFEHFRDMRSLVAVPLYDQGAALNMVVMLSKDPHGFDRAALPEHVWMSNLFGRATHNLVLSNQLRDAYDVVDRELQAVADIQRSLLPATLPQIPTLDLAAYYATSRRAGGDYYDVFPLPDGRWGILIADVSGHGTPAAVLMAVTHSLAHGFPEPPCPPSSLLARLNRQLGQHYTSNTGAFVTAFYGIYNPRTREFRYACAGHNPPRLKRCRDGSLMLLNQASGLPLGISSDDDYEEATTQLEIGDQIVFYTDGITEAFNPHGELFGTERLDEVLANCALTAQGLIDTLITAVHDFAAGQAADDDRTVLIAKVR